jgi:hypothetical protein
MLLEEGHPAEALIQYKVDLKLSRNGFDGLSNAARAAEACGQMDDAHFYYRELSESPIAAWLWNDRRSSRHTPS